MTEKAEPLYLVVDQGGHASRAMVFDDNGELQAQAVYEIQAEQPREGWVEYQAEALINSIQSVINTVVASLGTRAVAIKAAGLATQRSNVVCWNRETGEAVSPIISWQDRRMASWISTLESHSDEVHQKTGLFLNPHYGASKLRWCLDNLPQVALLQAQGKLAWGPMASYLIYQLTREHSLLVDPVNASRTLLWNIQTQAWDQSLLRLFGLPEGALPESVANDHSYGHLMVDGYEIPLRLVIGDQSASLFAQGAPDQDSLYLNLGTGAFLQRILPQPVDAERMLSSVVYLGPQRRLFALEGTVNGAGCALDDIAQQLALAPSQIFQHLDQWLAESTELPLFLNGVSGIGSPYWQPRFDSHFVGEGSDRQKVVAVVESILFLVQENIREMTGHVGPATQIIITGGLASQDGLCQLLADLTGLQVVRPEIAEATASGVFTLLAGWEPSQDEFHNDLFIPRQPQAIRQRYQRWHDALKSALSGI